MTAPGRSRYRVGTTPAPLPFAPPARFHLGENDEYVKYGHAPFTTPGRGDPYWTPEIITQTWFMAERGKIPISGAGYGGPFAGAGFDAIWLDMSEIVRPTRDGIHGREYISTSVDLGRKLPYLRPSAADTAGGLPPLVALPLPIVFNPFPFPVAARSQIQAIARAAHHLRTLALVTPEQWDDDLVPFADALAPRLGPDDVSRHPAMWMRARYAEVAGGDATVFGALKAARPDLVVGRRLALDEADPAVQDGGRARAGLDRPPALSDEGAGLAPGRRASLRRPRRRAGAQWRLRELSCPERVPRTAQPLPAVPHRHRGLRAALRPLEPHVQILDGARHRGDGADD